MSLEEMMAYINPDELLEVTPKNLRLRKYTYVHTREMSCASSKWSQWVMTLEDFARILVIITMPNNHFRSF